MDDFQAAAPRVEAGELVALPAREAPDFLAAETRLAAGEHVPVGAGDVHDVPGREFALGAGDPHREQAAAAFAEGGDSAGVDAERAAGALDLAYLHAMRHLPAALQAVLRTYVRGGVPVISRAAEVRQVAKDQFEARDARVSVSEFYTPHLSVGADRITVAEFCAWADCIPWEALCTLTQRVQRVYRTDRT